MNTRSAEQNRNRNRLKLLTIIATPFVLMVSAYFVYFTGIGIPEGTRNKGELIRPPQQLRNLELNNADGSQFDFASLPEKWTILIFGSSRCDEACAETLYLTRQIHIALGKYQHRVRRFFVKLDDLQDDALLSLIEKEHPHLLVLKGTASDVVKLMGTTDMKADPISGARFYLVDPDGFVMMYYTNVHTGHEVIDDIKFLLKFSSED